MNEIVIHRNELQPLKASEIRQQVGVIQDVLKNVMQKDVHYGVIPGCNAPSLYKPGAEKIMAAFRLAAEPEITDMSTADNIRYLVKVRLVSPSGVSLGAGIGECSSNEDKYKWRKAICKEEFDEAPAERRREKWMRGKGGSGYKVIQIRTEPADLANTILKMAKKRALIDAVLTVTAASDCFTQDIEDLPPEYLEDAPRVTEPPARIFWPDETFSPLLADKIKPKIESGERTVDDAIAWFKAKHDLTEQQINAIKECAPTQGEAA
jgi:hypothetical protein